MRREGHCTYSALDRVQYECPWKNKDFGREILKTINHHDPIVCLRLPGKLFTPHLLKSVGKEISMSGWEEESPDSPSSFEFFLPLPNNFLSVFISSRNYGISISIFPCKIRTHSSCIWSNPLKKILKFQDEWVTSIPCARALVVQMFSSSKILIHFYPRIPFQCAS